MNGSRTRFHALVGNMRPWQFKLAAILLTLAIVSAMSLLIHGRVTWDYLLTGFVASLVAYLITDLIYARFEQVEEATSRYRLLFECGGDAIAVVDGASGRFSDVNTAWCELYGYAREEALSLTPMDLLAGGQAGAMAGHRQWHRRKNGHIFPVEVAQGTARLGGRDLLCITTRDMSDRLKVDDTLALHKRAMEASSVGIVIADAQAPDLPLIYVNPAFERITGYAAAEALGRNCRFLQGPEREQPALEAIRAALRTGTEGRSLLRNYRKDGTPFWNELVITPVRDGIGRLTHFIGIQQDVTDRKEVEAVLERYAFMVNAVDEMMSVVSREHRYEAVNDQWCVMLGRRREEVIGASIAQVWGEKVYRESIAPLIEQCFSEGYPVSTQARVNLPGVGERECAITYYPYHAPAGKVAHAVVVTRDITEQVHAKLALQASESRLRTVLDSMVDGVIVIDERGTIESFNPAAERLFGYRADEVTGRNVSLLMPEPHAAAHDGYLRRYLETGEARIIGVGREVTGRRRDGSTFPMDLAVNPMASGGRRCFVGVVRDISARKAVELELVHALETAQVASRAKSEFLSSMSHELRTPMNAILGFAQLLHMDRGLGDEQKDNVAEILKAGRHLLALINEVLDLSRIESGKLALSMEPVALMDLVEECAALVESGAVRQGLSLERDLAQCEHRWVRADRLRLKQVLINLLSNAVKYNRRGGQVRITCGFATPGWVRLSVSDTGLGIPEDRQAELFTAFNRLGRENSTTIEGSGIGLVISKKLVELMGGEIGMESRPDWGSTFWVELAESPPLQAPGLAAADSRAAPDGGTARDGTAPSRTLLYVEDNPANLRLVQQALTRRPDLRLLTSGDPREGLALARSQRPDLILLDINLPGMDGYELLGHLRDDPDTRTTPVIAISANAMAGDIQRGLEAGFRVYLTKPLDLDRLLEEIDLTLGQETHGSDRRENT